MSFLAAQNSAGFSNGLSSVNIMFTAANGTVFNSYGTGLRSSEQSLYKFSYTLRNVGPWHNGTYTARVQSE